MNQYLMRGVEFRVNDGSLEIKVPWSTHPYTGNPQDAGYWLAMSSVSHAVSCGGVLSIFAPEVQELLFRRLVKIVGQDLEERAALRFCYDLMQGIQDAKWELSNFRFGVGYSFNMGTENRLTAGFVAGCHLHILQPRDPGVHQRIALMETHPGAAFLSMVRGCHHWCNHWRALNDTGWLPPPLEPLGVWDLSSAVQYVLGAFDGAKIERPVLGPHQDWWLDPELKMSFLEKGYR